MLKAPQAAMAEVKAMMAADWHSACFHLLLSGKPGGGAPITCRMMPGAIWKEAFPTSLAEKGTSAMAKKPQKAGHIKQPKNAQDSSYPDHKHPEGDARPW